MKKIVLIIDMQDGFMDDETESVNEKIGDLLKKAVFDYSIATVYQNTPEGPLVKFRDWTRFFSAEEQHLTETVGQCADVTLRKRRYSAVGMDLIDVLKKQNGGELPEAVFVVGIDTECCVLATALELFESGIRPVVLADYCGTTAGKVFHDAGLLSLTSLIGANNIYRGEVESKKDVEKILDYFKKNI